VPPPGGPRCDRLDCCRWRVALVDVGDDVAASRRWASGPSALQPSHASLLLHRRRARRRPLAATLDEMGWRNGAFSAVLVASVGLSLAPGCGGKATSFPSCVSGPTSAPDLQDQDSADVAWLRAHAFAVSCSPWNVAASQGKEPKLPGVAGAATRCAAVATNCSEWLTCSSGGHCPDYCAKHPFWSCDGDRTIVCDFVVTDASYGAVWEDCAASGQHCRDGSCSTDRPCAPPSLLHCDGTRQVSCSATTGLEYSRDCSYSAPGATCSGISIGSATFVSCSAPQEQCTGATFPARCEGDIAVTCFLGVTLSVNCADRPYVGHCVTLLNGTTDCRPNAASDCTDGDPDRCVGDALETCDAGHYAPANCTTLGFRTCGTTATGRPGCVH
jgi:hypothetical protein